MGASYSSEVDDIQPQNTKTPLVYNSDSEDVDENDYNNYRVAQLANVQQEARELFEKKNNDYGDAFANYGVVGVLVRMGDKIQRSASITKNGVSMVNNESLRDTLIDLANYACMGVMLLDETNE